MASLCTQRLHPGPMDCFQAGLKLGERKGEESDTPTDSLASQQALPLSDHSFTIDKRGEMANIYDFPTFPLFSIVETLFKRILAKSLM